MTTDDPTPIGQVLQAKAAELAERAAEFVDVDEDRQRQAAREARLALTERAAREHRWTDAMPSRFSWARVEHFGDVTATSAAGRQLAGQALEAWGRAPGGSNLVITGPTGTGKTHAAIAAARVAWELGAHVTFVAVVELLDALRPGGRPEVIDDLYGVDVLVLDDLGAERPTDWTVERLYALVNRRWMEERATVATTNLPLPELREALGERTYSRLVGSGATVLQLAGQDRRRA